MSVLTPHEEREARVEAVWMANRPLLIDVAYRIVRDIGEAEDLVQESFLRLLSADLDEIADVRAWLIVVVSRLCFDALGSARVRRTAHGVDPATAEASLTSRPPDPADLVTLDESVRMALLVVLEDLSPAERTVFVLHDVFKFSFESIAPIVGRSPAACRKLASRARGHVDTESSPARFAVEPTEHRRIADQFIAACAGGNLVELMGLLDPNVVGDVDAGARMPPQPVVEGRAEVAAGLLRFLAGRSGVTLVTQPINGKLGVLAFRRRALIALVVLESDEDLIVDIHAIIDPEKLALIVRWT